MRSNLRSGKTCGVLYRGGARGFALAICPGAFPALAGQNRQGQPPAAVLQTEDESAPAGTPQAPASSHVQVPPTLTLPAGTVITVRVSQFLSSDQNRPGDGFSAELQQPLVVDGWVVSRRGQMVLGRVAVAEKAGRAKGTSQLGVELSHSVLVDGQQLPIRTQLMQTSAGTSQGRDAQAVGTTTGISAAIGAAAGIAGVLLTRGRPTVIPPETLLTFQLEFPLTFSTQRSGPAFRPVTQEDYDAGTLRRRSQHFVVAPNPPPPPNYWGYYPWGYYPGPVFFRYYGFGSRFGRRGFRH